MPWKYNRPKSDSQAYSEEARKKDLRVSCVAQVRKRIDKIIQDLEKQAEDSGEEPRADEFWDVIDKIWSILDSYNGEKF
jgi:hypothetical protein